MHNPKVILIIMDGWGYSPIEKGNAIAQAKTPTFDYLWNNYTHTLLNAFGENVGLPWGAIGSSEVGHASIGSGRLISQELSLIDTEIENKKFFSNSKIVDFIHQVDKAKGDIHLIGLVSNGGVHSHQKHLYSLLQLIKLKKFNGRVFIHAITDGRDTAPKSAEQYLSELTKKIKSIGVNARIVSVSGRYYAMDRDNRWERTKLAYHAMAYRDCELVSGNFHEAISNAYQRGETDEFIKPTLIDSCKEKMGFFDKLLKKEELSSEQCKVDPYDGVLFFNIRPDRMRQLTEIFLFPRSNTETRPVPNLNVLTLTTYSEFLPVAVAYPTKKISDPLAKVLSDHKYKQGHFAETEKYAHVTYFFNGGNAEKFPGESWHLVPSPKVATYDLKPEMSASKVTDEVLKAIETEKLDFVLINYANCDMVGHTGKFDKVVQAVESIDDQLKRLLVFLPKTTLMITADHGNSECMIHPETGEVDKKHTVNPVPFILVNEKFKKTYDENDTPQQTGILADITPTILSLLKLHKTKNMNGIDLIDSLK